ncbi:MAG: hypothetical protein KA004_13340 [Verrucomicrobiales bacterium]|nr:hypothetical protein [Verrucomicrobiales bacterium]
MQQATAKQRGSTTFHVACGVFVAVALGQGVVAAWGWKNRLAASGELPAVEAPKPPPSKIEPPKDLPPATVAKVEPSPAVAAPAGDSLLPDALPSRLSLDVPITDETVLENLDRCLALRQQGDMQGALEAIRKACEIQPDHPKLLYQLATTLDLMGLEAKAQPHWRTLFSLGAAAGDIYFRAAELRLKEKPNADATAAAEEREGRYKIVAPVVTADPTLLRGERQTLRFNIRRVEAAAQTDVAAIELKVHFFDQVNGRVDRTTAAVSAPVFPDVPFDFQPDGVEPVEMLCEQAEMTPEEIRKFGQRRFYGYCLELYYQGKLQDVAAEPLLCLDLAREIPEVLPPAPAAAGNLDGSLFPK